MLTVAGQQFGALEMFLNSIGSRETKNKYRNKVDITKDFKADLEPFIDKLCRIEIRLAS